MPGVTELQRSYTTEKWEEVNNLFEKEYVKMFGDSSGWNTLIEMIPHNRGWFKENMREIFFRCHNLFDTK